MLAGLPYAKHIKEIKTYGCITYRVDMWGPRLAEYRVDGGSARSPPLSTPFRILLFHHQVSGDLTLQAADVFGTEVIT